MPSVSIALFEKDRLVRIVPVERVPFVIGRGAASDLTLDHPVVSRQHARVVVSDGRPMLVDAGATNGIQVNGCTARSFALAPGDRLAVGPYTLHFDVGAARPPGRPHRALRALVALAGELGGAVERSELLKALLDGVIETFDAERGFLLLTDGPSGELAPALARRLDEKAPDATISFTVAREVARTGESLLIEDVKACARFQVAPSIVEGGIRSILCVPLPGVRQPAGVLYLDSPIAARAFLPADLELVETVAAHAARLLEHHGELDALRRDRARWKDLQARNLEGFDRMVASAPAAARVVEQARRAAAQGVCVLLLGESGTGKELFARAIHKASPRADGPFVAVNCAALSRGVVESELFGHARGAFSGADDRRQGRFELADGGTLFLDEVADVPLDVQVKLLRVIEERAIEPVGDNRPVPIDVRLVCATNAAMDELVARRAFREDLYYRINAFTLELPALRDRREDIPELAEHLIAELAGKMRREVDGLDPTALAALVAYPWPGNIRELRNVLERALVLESGPRISAASLPFARPAPAQPEQAQRGPLEQARDGLDRTLILDALSAARGNISAAARKLGLHRMSLQRRMEALGIDMLAWAGEQESMERERLGTLLARHGGDVAAVAAALGTSRSTAYRRLKALGLTPD